MIDGILLIRYAVQQPDAVPDEQAAIKLFSRSMKTRHSMSQQAKQLFYFQTAE